VIVLVVVLKVFDDMLLRAKVSKRIHSTRCTSFSA
jgi:hypothetical protein